MNKRKWFFIILILIISISVYANEIIDSLWQKAEKIASKSWNLVPGKIQKKKEVFKINGYLKSFKTVSLGCEVLEDSINVFFINAKSNSKALPESNSYVQDEIKRNYYPKNHSIFHNNCKYKVEYKKTDEIMEINGKQYVIYEVDFLMEENREIVEYIGKVWLNAETGIPYILEKSPKKLSTLMKSFVKITEYDVDANGFWIKKSETTITEVKMLFIRLKMKLEYTYSNYCRFPKNK
ncbi:MAG: hypothetical protein K8S23_14740 [Candidatus Cloacimonetes bacterium]|nr:hypothetical protein [Candidatus Cloacimonadota bacterium]